MWHQVGYIWRDGDVWRIQMGHGIHTALTMLEAHQWAVEAHRLAIEAIPKNVCDDCLTVAFKKGIEAAEQASTMVMIGAELPDHLCVELDGEIRCDCGCHGQAKQRIRNREEVR